MYKHPFVFYAQDKRTALMLAAGSSADQALDVVKALVKSKASLNLKDAVGGSGGGSHLIFNLILAPVFYDG